MEAEEAEGTTHQFCPAGTRARLLGKSRVPLPRLRVGASLLDSVLRPQLAAPWTANSRSEGVNPVLVAGGLTSPGRRAVAQLLRGCEGTSVLPSRGGGRAADPAAVRSRLVGAGWLSRENRAHRHSREVAASFGALVVSARQHQLQLCRIPVASFWQPISIARGAAAAAPV